jgi:hypothetical protein
MSDIIEIGEDGTFELPSPVRETVLAQRRDFDDNAEIATHHDVPSVIDLEAGEYRVYKDKNGNLDVVVRLFTKEQVKSVHFDESQLYIESGLQTISVPLLRAPKSASAKNWEDFLVTKVVV